MDADIKALENEAAKIKTPTNPPIPIIEAPIIPTNHQLTASNASYNASRGQSTKSSSSIQYHPYGPPPPRANLKNKNIVNAVNVIQQQLVARNAANAIAQVQAVRLQAQAAAINAARTRTFISAHAQAHAARAAAIARANAVRTNTSSVITSGPNKSSMMKHNDDTATNTATMPTANNMGPSYTKNPSTGYDNVGNKYHKSYHHNKHHYHHNNGHNRYYSSHHHGHYNNTHSYNGYPNDKKTTTTIPNSSLRNHLLSDMDNFGGSSSKSAKKKKLIASHQYQLRTAAKESWVDPTMTDWPENDFRIFCGDLGNEVSDAMLTSAFSKYPSFAKAKVIRDKRTGKSKGYGFCSFLEPQDFIRAFKEMNGKYVGNRPIKLRRSKWKDRMKKVKNFKIRE